MQSKNRGWMVLALFFGSGATALVYEVVWAKFLAQMFGSTIYAQTVVLAVFMGGLALGNRIFGGWSDGLRNPVKAYGVLEILIGVYAFLFHTLERLTDKIFIAAGTPIVEHSGWLLLLKGVLSAALLLGPTILMGGTLPLLAAWLNQSGGDASRRSARFYSVNSLGAVAGAASAGFWLVQNYGMIATIQITATANVVIGLSAILLNRSGWLAQPVAAAGKTDSAPALPSETLRWAGVIVAMTGGVSMGLEILASRSLALIFGSSLQSFAVVLIAFILGIGLGSAWIASPRRASKTGEKTVVGLLCVAAAWVTLLVFNIEQWVDFYRIARIGLSRTPVGYVYHELLTVLIALVILGIPAALIGTVLPLMIRAMAGQGEALGARVGTLLTWNTLGAVAGTLITGFGLMPFFGLRNAFGVLALVLAVVALIIALRRGWLAGVVGTAGACGLVGCLFLFGGESWRNVMSSGIFRINETSFQSGLMAMRKNHFKILFYEDGPDATVSVEQVDGIVAPAALGLRTNGKPEAGTQLDLSTQFLVSHLPMMAKPGAKDVFVLGLASGMTAGVMLAYPIDRLDVAENCEPVIHASKLFDDWNRHVLDDPRTHLWREDARTVLKLRPQLYDVIITEPSNPWFVGTGSVFSQEYYKLAASRLKPGGIMAQWFQVYETQDDMVQLVLRTFSSVFPYVEIWDAGAGDIVLIGAMQPWPTGPEVFRQSFAIDRVRTDMWMINVESPEALLARQLASQRTGFAIADKGPIQSDLFPVLEYAAPRAFFLGNGSKVLWGYDERTRQQLLAPAEKVATLAALPMAMVQLVFSDFFTVNGDVFSCVFGTAPNAGVPCVFQTPLSVPPPMSDGSPIAKAEKAFQAGDYVQAETLTQAVLQQNPNDAQAGYLLRVISREKQLHAATNH
jgi:predicted membrane-bound spermidine synthase